MKSILVGRGSQEISFAMDAAAVEELIAKLQEFQKTKREARFSIETIGDKIDLVFMPFDVQDKQVQEFFENKNEIEAINKKI